MKYFGAYQIDVTRGEGRLDSYRWHLFRIGAREPFLSSMSAFRSETAAFVDAKSVVRRHAERTALPDRVPA